jgi:hypothetical protein
MGVADSCPSIDLAALATHHGAQTNAVPGAIVYNAEGKTQLGKQAQTTAKRLQPAGS